MKQKIEQFIKEVGIYNLKQVISEIEDNKDAITKEQQMEEFFLSVVNGLTIQISNEYPESVFYKKGDLVYLQQDKKRNNIWCRYSDFWLVFESKFGINYQQIQGFLKRMFSKHLKIEGLTPGAYYIACAAEFGKHLK